MLSRGVRSIQNVTNKLYKGSASSPILNNMYSSQKNYETLNVTVPKEFIYHVELNRAKNLNSLNHAMWIEIGRCFDDLDKDENCRVVVLSGSGKLFTAGLDFNDAAMIGSKLSETDDVARRAKILKSYINLYQNSITSLEICKKPVIAAVHSACVGAGVDLITAADIRYCCNDAWFQVKEVDIGLAADVGTLQRLPKVIGNDSLARELCYTARKLLADEAHKCGLVSKVFENKDQMLQEALSVAETIAKKSPVAVQGTKASLVFSRDHSVQEGLDNIALYNQMAMQSEDFTEATIAAATKQKDIVFAKL